METEQGVADHGRHGLRSSARTGVGAEEATGEPGRAASGNGALDGFRGQPRRRCPWLPGCKSPGPWRWGLWLEGGGWGVLLGECTTVTSRALKAALGRPLGRIDRILSSSGSSSSWP